MSHFIEALRHVLLRELESFKREVESYPDEESLWATPSGIANSTGTLALHCAGNLQHFVGARLGATEFVRDRNAEFARRSVPRVELVAGIDRAVESVRSTLGNLTEETLPAVFPDQFAGKSVRSDVMLVHLAVHLAYHLGQADYHRRLTAGDARTLDAIAIGDLPHVGS